MNISSVTSIGIVGGVTGIFLGGGWCIKNLCLQPDGDSRK